MRLMVRHVSRDGMNIKSEIIADAANPRSGAVHLANQYYISTGERIDVLILRHDEMIRYDVKRGRLDSDDDTALVKLINTD